MQKTQDEFEQKVERREADAPSGPESFGELEAHFELPSGMEIDPEDLRPRPWVRPDPKRVALVAAILLALLLIAVLPPLISANRFRRRITQSVSESLGRPVHMRDVAFTMLPMPGFTLTDFEVEDDPAFGSEPVIQARTVRVTLRVWSLWRRRVEFSRISLDDPSVNLVHRADGQWNIESILLQAEKIEAAPTEQTGAGPAPRFPYIEATGARINVKMGLEKMPLALTEADLALWLPQPSQWRLRLEGRPTRTDTAPTDTGTLRVEGTLGKADTIENVPVDLAAEWRNAPLGGVSYVLIGRDAGFRGDMTLRASIRGTVGQNAVASRLEVNELRRADFVPRRMLDVNLSCNAQAGAAFHQLTKVRCGWPSEVLESKTVGGLLLQGEMPDAGNPQRVTMDAGLKGVPASEVLDVLRLMSARVSPDLTASGTISGEFVCCAGKTQSPPWTEADGLAKILGAKLVLNGGKPFVDGDLSGAVAEGVLILKPVALELGGAQPAQLEGRVDAGGYRLHLSGMVLRSRLMQLGTVLPQFGDGLDQALPPAPEEAVVETPMRVDLVSNRTWSGGQTWTPAVVKTTKRHRTGRRN